MACDNLYDFLIENFNETDRVRLIGDFDRVLYEGEVSQLPAEYHEVYYCVRAILPDGTIEIDFINGVLIMLALLL